MRIVSLCPSITETLIDFGLTGSLVGVTRYCIHPKAITKTLHKVGGTKNPDFDAIRAVAPDLIFVNEEENTKEAFEILSQEYPVEVSFPRTVGEVPELLRRFGRLTDSEATAERRAEMLERGLAELDRAARASLAARGGARLRFAYLIWREPWMTINSETYVSDLLCRAGGENAFARAADRYPTITLDQLAAARPNVVLLPDEPYHFREKDRLELAGALPDSRVELVSGDDCCWHGVRSIRGVTLAQSLFAG